MLSEAKKGMPAHTHRTFPHPTLTRDPFAAANITVALPFRGHARPRAMENGRVRRAFPSIAPFAALRVTSWGNCMIRCIICYHTTSAKVFSTRRK
jgi:hypothetical protein